MSNGTMATMVPLPNALTGRAVPTGASVQSDWVTAEGGRAAATQSTLVGIHAALRRPLAIKAAVRRPAPRNKTSGDIARNI